jgi:predicted dehydrogenase
MARPWTVHQRKSIGKRADGPPPSGVDYNLWLGPAAARPFNPNRFHHNWHWFWDYGAGELGNWGVHLLDVARWGLGVELPETISATGGCYFFHDDQQTPDTLQVNYGYPGRTITWEHRLWSPHGQEGRSAAVAFYGDRGTLIVDRGGWKVYGQKESATAGSSELLPPHLRNFIQSLKTREAPVADLESAHLSSGLCHLGNIAYRVGRTLSFDQSQGTFGNDDEANALLRTTYKPLVAAR